MNRNGCIVAAFAILLAIVAAPSLWGLWAPNGVAICTATNAQLSPRMDSDSLRGAFIAWSDKRNGGDRDIYAQRVDRHGVPVWTPNGVPICVAGHDQYDPDVVYDHGGGAVVVWADLRPGTPGVYAQRVDGSGVPQWTAGGVALCPGNLSYSGLRITTNKHGGAIATWVDDRSGRNAVYAQHVSYMGGALWALNGVALCTHYGVQSSPRIAPDGTGGAIVVWEDYRNSSGDIYAQRVDSTGDVQWPASGRPICSTTGIQQHPQIVSDGAGGAIIVWQDFRNSSNYDIYAQRVDASGASQWTAGGLGICKTAGNQLNPQVVSDGAGGAIVAWIDGRAGDEMQVIYAQRVDASGTALWVANGEPLCMEPGWWATLTMVSDGRGGAIAVWEPMSAGAPENIFAQRVNGSGVCQWWENGVVLCAVYQNPDDALYPRIISDSRGGAIVAWQDFRASGGGDIYAQWISMYEGQPFATLLQNYAAGYSGSAIDITWTLSEMDGEAEFLVLRAEGSPTQFEEIPAAVVARSGFSFAFSDRDIEPGTSYWYRVDIVIGEKRSRLFEAGPVATPAMPLTLYQNHPNPFNPSTTIRYYLPVSADVRLDVCGATGARIVTLAEGKQEKGTHAVAWNGRDAAGRQVASGIYFCRLAAGKETLSRKLVLMR